MDKVQRHIRRNMEPNTTEKPKLPKPRTNHNKRHGEIYRENNNQQ